MAKQLRIRKGTIGGKHYEAERLTEKGGGKADYKRTKVVHPKPSKEGQSVSYKTSNRNHVGKMDVERRRDRSGEFGGKAYTSSRTTTNNKAPTKHTISSDYQPGVQPSTNNTWRKETLPGATSKKTVTKKDGSKYSTRPIKKMPAKKKEEGMFGGKSSGRGSVIKPISGQSSKLKKTKSATPKSMGGK